MTKKIITPDTLAARGDEFGLQAAFFLALNMAAMHGFRAALAENSYFGAVQAKTHGTGPIPQLKFIFAIPNGERRDAITGSRLKAAGVKPGVPDIFIPIPASGYHGAYLELKRKKGGRVSDAQDTYIDFLSSQGYACYVCTDWREAIATVRDYLYPFVNG